MSFWFTTVVLTQRIMWLEGSYMSHSEYSLWVVLLWIQPVILLLLHLSDLQLGILASQVLIHCFELWAERRIRLLFLNLNFSTDFELKICGVVLYLYSGFLLIGLMAYRYCCFSSDVAFKWLAYWMWCVHISGSRLIWDVGYFQADPGWSEMLVISSNILKLCFGGCRSVWMIFCACRSVCELSSVSGWFYMFSTGPQWLLGKSTDRPFLGDLGIFTMICTDCGRGEWECPCCILLLFLLCM